MKEQDLLVVCSTPTAANNAMTKASPTAASVFEVEELRECLRRFELKCENLERERDLHMTRANELASLLDVRTKRGDIETSKQLIHKAVKVAELSHEADVLRSQLSKSTGRVKELETDCKTQRTVLLELSQIFRSANANHHDVVEQMEAIRLAAKEDENSKEDDGFFNMDHILSPQQALDLTMTTLREQIEALEDEREGFIRRIQGLRNSLEEQRRENEARELKIEALEKQMEQFVSENATLMEFLGNSIEVIEAAESDTTGKPMARKWKGKTLGWRIRNKTRRNDIV